MATSIKHIWSNKSILLRVLPGAKNLSASHIVIFASLLGLWIFSSVLMTSMLSVGVKHTTVIRVALVVLMVLNDMYWNISWYKHFLMHSKHVALLILIVASCAICMLLKYYWLPQLVIIAFCARGFNWRDVVKIWIASVFLSVVFVLLSCLLGISPDFVVPRAGMTGRHSFGFTYATFLSHYYLGIVSGLIYLQRRNMTLISIGFLAAINLLIFLLTDSKTAFILTMMMLAAVVAVKGFRIRCRVGVIPGFLLKHSFLICAFLSLLVFLCVDVHTGSGALLNSVMSNRISLTQQAFAQYSISLTGNEINWATTQLSDNGTIQTGYRDTSGQFINAPYFYVDNSFLNTLISKGPIVLLLALVFLDRLSSYAVQSKDISLAALLAVFALRAVVDPQLLDLHYCPFLLFIMVPWFCNKTVKGADRFRPRSV